MKDDPRDHATEIRQGEDLDRDALATWLRDALELDGELAIEQFPSGFSNLTYLLKLGERELVLRRPPFGAAGIRGGHDMAREHRVLSRVVDVWPRVPRPLAYCDDTEVIGAPFYVMERVSGVILRAKPPKGLELYPARFKALSKRAIDTLAELHALDVDALGLAELGKGPGYVERQISGWSRRWHKAKTDDVPTMDRAATWLGENQPADSGVALIHNDYKYDNLVLDPDEPAHIIAILDWEMSTVGDPMMDLGTTLGYWIEAADPAPLRMFGLTALPGNLDRARLVERYREQSNCSFDDPLFYFVYGVFKIGVIVQQIYARYKAGHTQDPRFADLIHVVQACGATAERALDTGRISDLWR
ncbi:MAG: phosphotransferase family protein [Acidobacteriota bacterium]